MLDGVWYGSFEKASKLLRCTYHTLGIDGIAVWPVSRIGRGDQLLPATTFSYYVSFFHDLICELMGVQTIVDFEYFTEAGNEGKP
mmetsp:Transcript_17409/g.33048  ORF Transcript_17409/g.33048 Transcript_17409/m.33048 type:complete len:85 (-) Transcript_17409:17-271(-)|eukprot:scaffold4286_cov92-Amphora_coffeaeformis.AAC.13